MFRFSDAIWNRIVLLCCCKDKWAGSLIQRMQSISKVDTSSSGNRETVVPSGDQSEEKPGDLVRKTTISSAWENPTTEMQLKNRASNTAQESNRKHLNEPYQDISQHDHTDKDSNDKKDSGITRDPVPPVTPYSLFGQNPENELERIVEEAFTLNDEDMASAGENDNHNQTNMSVINQRVQSPIQITERENVGDLLLLPGISSPRENSDETQMQHNDGNNSILISPTPPPQ